ncbi:MAG: outer membrane protein assembly factor BamA [Enterobacterales bacterium]|jgi:outer membrane protein assembly factor BamA
MKLLVQVSLIIFLLMGQKILSETAIEEIIFTSSDSAEQSQILKEDKGSWLPVPIPVSNPTIGTGLQAILLYIHPQNSEKKDVPNATSGIVAMYTDSDSRMFGIFHENNFLDDTFRLKTFAGISDFNLHYFGFGEDRENLPLKYNIETESVFVEFLSLIPNTKNWFIGPKILWIDADLSFKLNFIEHDLPPITSNSVTSSLGLVVSYDDRDDNYYPSKGHLFEFSVFKDDENWGSHYNFEKTSMNYSYYHPVSNNQVLAFKGSMTDVSGKAPFYMMSNLDLRGNAFGRYIDNSSASIHAEWRYKFRQRWGMIGFVETGSVAESFSELGNNKRITSYGIGLRWQPIATESLHIGLDVALSSDDSAIYIRVGESF